MTKKKVMVTYPIFKQGLSELFDRYEVFYPENIISREEILKVLPGYDAVIACGFRADREAMACMDNVKIISTHSAGYDSIDINAANEKGILVCNLPDVVTESTAEFGMALMLAVMRRVTEVDRKIKMGLPLSWGPVANIGRGLNGKRLGIVGMGRIGKAIARRAKAFLMDITYHNRHRLSAEVEAEYSAAYVPTLVQLLKESDVVILNAPLTDETYHMIGTKQFAVMKREAYFINIGRGPLVNEPELIKALQEGRIAGAGLDVFEHEPNVPAELKELDNVVLGAHMATATLETKIAMGRMACKNVIDYFEYGKHPNLVNLECLSNKRL